jgi:hypothetical protein
MAGTVEVLQAESKYMLIVEKNARLCAGQRQELDKRKKDILNSGSYNKQRVSHVFKRLSGAEFKVGVLKRQSRPHDWLELLRHSAGVRTAC